MLLIVLERLAFDEDCQAEVVVSARRTNRRRGGRRGNRQPSETFIGFVAVDGRRV
jgi:hypothetical protein